MKTKDFKEIIPKRFHQASYSDISREIKEIIEKQINSSLGVYLYGASGVGKTHIVASLIKNLLSQDFDVKFLNTGAFLEKIRREYNENFRGDEEYQGIFEEILNFEGIIVFDDIGAEKTTEWVLERLYLIINRKYEDMVPIIFTSNYNLSELSNKIGDRLVSRIAGMTEKIKIEGEDKRLINK